MNCIDRDIRHSVVARMINLDVEGRAHVAYWTVRDAMDDAHENDDFATKERATGGLSFRDAAAYNINAMHGAGFELDTTAIY